MSRTSPMFPLRLTLSCSVLCLAGACQDISPIDGEPTGHSESEGEATGDGVPTTGCESECGPPPDAPDCGDGVAEAGEGCDDGNTVAGDGCSSTCQPESCGDGVVQDGEECDDGADSPTCDADCTYASCGDSYANVQANEECDDGNLIDNDRCSDGCTLIAPCGDGVVDPGEACDDGMASATCDADCTVAACGDGYVNSSAGEQCDDANAVNDDACSNACTIPVCGGGRACGVHLWSKRFGDGGEQRASGVAVDAAGNVVFTGAFTESMNMGGGSLLSQGGNDLFLAKFSPAGEFVWSKRFGDETEQIGHATAVDSQGNILVTGEFHGVMKLGGEDLVSQGHADLFVAKFTPAGEHLWSHRFGDGDFQFGRAIAVDGQDNVLVTGNLWGTTDLGAGDLVSQGSDFFVAKFSPAGELLWDLYAGDGEVQLGQSLAVDTQGNVVVAGDMRGTMDLGGGLLVSAGGRDLFVAKFTPAGDPLWSHSFGDLDDQYSSAVAVDGQDNVVLTGEFLGAVNFGGGDLVSAGKKDVFVAKFSPVGEHVWSQRHGDGEKQSMNGAAVDGAGNIVLTGAFAGAMDLGGGALVSQGGDDVFVAKFTAAGDHVWSRRAGDWNNQSGRAVAVDGQGNVVIAGGFASEINLGGDDLVTGGLFDLYLAKLGG